MDSNDPLLYAGPVSTVKDATALMERHGVSQLPCARTAHRSPRLTCADRTSAALSVLDDARPSIGLMRSDSLGFLALEREQAEPLAGGW